jgi:hypothetical protein
MLKFVPSDADIEESRKQKHAWLPLPKGLPPVDLE